jgi:hypothetical protein
MSKASSAVVVGVQKDDMRNRNSAARRRSGMRRLEARGAAGELANVAEALVSRRYAAVASVMRAGSL